MAQIDGIFDPAHGTSLQASGLVNAELAVLPIRRRMPVELKIDTGCPCILLLDKDVLNVLLDWGFIPPPPKSDNVLPPVRQARKWMKLRPYWFLPLPRPLHTANGVLTDVFEVEQAMVRLCSSRSPPDGGARELEPVYVAFSERYRTRGMPMRSLLGQNGINAVQSFFWSYRKHTITLYDR